MLLLPLCFHRIRSQAFSDGPNAKTSPPCPLGANANRSNRNVRPVRQDLQACRALTDHRANLAHPAKTTPTSINKQSVPPPIYLNAFSALLVLLDNRGRLVLLAQTDLKESLEILDNLGELVHPGSKDHLANQDNRAKLGRQEQLDNQEKMLNTVHRCPVQKVFRALLANLVWLVNPDKQVQKDCLEKLERSVHLEFKEYLDKMAMLAAREFRDCLATMRLIVHVLHDRLLSVVMHKHLYCV